MATPAERYLAHLDQVFQTEPEFFRNESLVEGQPGVTAIVYRDIPEKGMVTGLTYGLSLVPHPDWKLSRPELLISVESTDTAWAQVAAAVANRLRGQCPFSYGETIRFRETVADESKMDAFLVFAPSILEDVDYLGIDIGAPYRINIAGLYPVHDEEIQLIETWGLEKFWQHPDFDIYDVRRAPLRPEA